ncbi:MAG: N-methyl-L-tryptophan oxidase [Candidatus Sericytochromatia bacterium]
MGSAYRVPAVVIGLGAMGSACLWQLSRQGIPVLGIDQFQPPHHYGSSHGRSRIIREAYFEHPDYVPLLQMAYRAWADLESESGEDLLHITGGLMIGPQTSHLVTGCLTSARNHRLAHRLLSAFELQDEWPPFHIPSDFGAVYEPRSGWLNPEACIRSSLKLAQQQGAETWVNTSVLNWESRPDGILIQTEKGEVITQHLVLSAGAWTQRLLPQQALPLQVTRQVLFWFETLTPEVFRPEVFPIFLLEDRPDHYLYGFPDTGSGFKVALHVPGEAIVPEALHTQQLRPEEEAEMRELLEVWLPAANGRLLHSEVCLYTNTPNQHFVIDTLPADPRVLVLSPCSGHGFKFASAIGEIAARWVSEQTLPPGLELFHINRPA